MLREDRQLLILTHISQLLNLITGFGGLIVPLIIWFTQRDKILEMEEQGKEIINFQISLFIYSILCIPLILLFGLGILLLVIVGLLTLILPIVNAIKVSNGEIPNYPFTIKILK